MHASTFTIGHVSVPTESLLGEGPTPQVELPSLARELEVGQVVLKLEGLNPTGSYKDRVAAASMRAAVRQDARAWILTSSGNAGSAMAAYGARVGLPGLVLVNNSIPPEKLLPVLAFGATVIQVSDVGAGAHADTSKAFFAAVEAAAKRHHLYLAVTTYEHNALGMAGAEAIGQEIAQLADPVEAIYVPTGGGGLATAIARGLRKAQSEARVVVCQPAGCAPIAMAVEGDLRKPRVEQVETTISGLQLPDPPDGRRAVRAVKETSGHGVAVMDSAILAAQRSLREKGAFAEAASATALAGAAEDRRRGRLTATSRICLVLTGTGLKDLSRNSRRSEPAQHVVVGQLDGALDRWVTGLA
jgi:threonine synthase